MTMSSEEIRGRKVVVLRGCGIMRVYVVGSSRRSSHLPQTVELASQFRSAFKIKSRNSLCDNPLSRHIGGSCSALQMNLGSVSSACWSLWLCRL